MPGEVAMWSCLSVSLPNRSDGMKASQSMNSEKETLEVKVIEAAIMFPPKSIWQRNVVV